MSQHAQACAWPSCASCYKALVVSVVSVLCVLCVLCVAECLVAGYPCLCWTSKLVGMTKPPIIGNYVSLPAATRASIVDLRMRECLCANAIARRLRLPTSTVRNVLAQEGIS